MKMKTTLSLGAFLIVAILVAGVSYRAIREEPRPASPNNRAEVTAPPNASQTTSEKRQPIGQHEAGSAAPAPAAAAPAPATGSSQPGKPSASVSTAARVATMPSEHKMSAANRRKVQEALRHLGYYRGRVDGIFGPQTRAAIRRFQNSIGSKGTGYLTAVEASRLASTS